MVLVDASHTAEDNEVVVLADTDAAPLVRAMMLKAAVTWTEDRLRRVHMAASLWQRRTIMVKGVVR